MSKLYIRTREVSGAGHDYFYTTALPTEPYFSKAFLKLSRRYNDALVRRLGTELCAYSRSDHSGTASWFRLMGFTEIGLNGDARVFVYPITKPDFEHMPTGKT